MCSKPGSYLLCFFILVLSPFAAAEDSDKLVLANQRLEIVTSENVTLKESVAASENTILDLKRLIAMKDEELAALQQKVASEPADEEIVTSGE